MESNSLVHVSTIHSFCWNLIQGLTSDIKTWLHSHLAERIANTQAKLQRGRTGTKAEKTRRKKLAKYEHRLASLENINRFSYSPTGDNSGRASLNHNEVISIASSLLARPVAQTLLVSRYPFLLIDESQDTNRELIESLLNVQAAQKTRFSLGLFGDMMQRIYGDGKSDLVDCIPTDWQQPEKLTNYRCPKRVIRLINRIRKQADGREQHPKKEAVEGLVRLFLLSTLTGDKSEAERKIAGRMAELTGDTLWATPDRESYKTLILEHHMAAQRMGFQELFDPLYQDKDIQTGLLEGTLRGIRFFLVEILPAIDCLRHGQEFELMAHLRSFSPLLAREVLTFKGPEQLKVAKDATHRLLNVLIANPDPSSLAVLELAHETNLFEVPDELSIYCGTNQATDDDGSVDPWFAALSAPISQVEKLGTYVQDKSSFGTHQGVKGLEFERVMVINSDDEARGNWFSYEKILGGKELSPTDQTNLLEGKDGSIDRTHRLFYVTCSRAEKSLAIVTYTQQPTKAKDFVVQHGLFDESEVEMW